MPFGVGSGGRYNVAVGVHELDRHPCKRCLGRQLFAAVRIGVVPHRPRDIGQRRLLVAIVGVQVGRARRRQRHLVLGRRRRCRILVGRRRRVAGQGCLVVVHAHPEGARRQVGKEVLPAAAGDPGGDQDVARPRLKHPVAVVEVELDRHPGDARLTRVLHGVAVVVAKDRIPDGAQPRVAKVLARHVGARHRHRQLARRRLGRGILEIGQLAGVVGDDDGVGAVRHAVEGEGAICRRDAGGDDVAQAVDQVDRHARDAHLARIEYPVAVRIVPDRVADRSEARLLVAKVGVQVGVAGHDRDRQRGVGVGLRAAGQRVAGRRCR